MKHFWIELCYASREELEKKSVLKYLRTKIKELLQILREREEVALIHCAAGVHRTGTLGYTVLRLASVKPLSQQ